jgi:pimeloyl-ACP methyl ester carboxylesterase
MAATAARLLPGTVHRRLVQRLLVRVEHPEMRDRIRDELFGHEPATVIQAAEAVTRFSSHDWIGGVDVPTAVLVTALDELVPAVRQRKLARSIPGAEVFEVAGDHDACVRCPEFPPTLVRACLAVTRREAGRAVRRV